jgi:zinc protease
MNHRRSMAALAPAMIALLAFLISFPSVSFPEKARGEKTPALKKVTTIEGITEYQLDNGLRVLLFPDPSAANVTVNLTVFVGSRHEGYGETGMAHLLEHMVFKGTPTHRDIPKLLKEHGARFNGSTWVDRTNYFETMAGSDANLEFGIRLEADRMINSFVKREDLVSEMTVVRSEFEMGENSPERVLNQRMMAVAYEWHNYGKSTIGNRSDIERVPIDKLQAFYHKYYRPDNAMLVVAGKFDEVFWPDSTAQGKPRRDLHRRAGPGWRAACSAAPGRQDRRRRPDLSHPGRPARRLARHGGPQWRPRQGTLGPFV